MGFELAEKMSAGRGAFLDGVSVLVGTTNGYLSVPFCLGPDALAAVGDAPHGVHVLVGSGADAGKVRIVAAREGERGRSLRITGRGSRTKRVTVAASHLGLSGGKRPTVRPTWRALDGGGIEVEMPWGAEDGK